MLLPFLDAAFFVFHTLLIGFNMTGWAWRRTRRLHRIVLGLTIFSWFGLGAFYGWGYCLCTDWHFQVRRELGYRDPDTSYIQLLLRKAFGVQISRGESDVLAVSVLAAIVIAAAVVWAMDRARSKGRKQSVPNPVHPGE